jgi:hypothetical protein
MILARCNPFKRRDFVHGGGQFLRTVASVACLKENPKPFRFRNLWLISGSVGPRNVGSEDALNIV